MNRLKSMWGRVYSTIGCILCSEHVLSLGLQYTSRVTWQGSSAGSIPPRSRSTRTRAGADAKASVIRTVTLPQPQRSKRLGSRATSTLASKIPPLKDDLGERANLEICFSSAPSLPLMSESDTGCRQIHVQLYLDPGRLLLYEQ